MSKRDALRSKTVAAPKIFKNELVDLGGEKVEVRQPSVEQRGVIIASGGSIDPEDPKKVKIDVARMQANAVIALCYVAGTEEKVFEEADRESMLAAPAASGGWFDKLASVAQSMLNVDLDDAKNA